MYFVCCILENGRLIDKGSLAWPDPFRTGAYRLEIISAGASRETKVCDACRSFPN